jgi:hypothetical protein
LGSIVFFKFSVILQFITGITPLLFLFFFKRKLRTELVLLLLASAITTLVLYITGSLKIKNWFFLNLYSTTALACLSIYYHSIIQSKALKKMVVIIASFCGAVIIMELTYLDLINLSLAAVFLCLTFFSILYFIDNLDKSSTPISKPYFIINTTFFVYYSFSFFMSFEIQTMMANQYWIIHNLVEASSKLVIAYAILKIPKTTEEMNSKSVT